MDYVADRKEFYTKDEEDSVVVPKLSLRHSYSNLGLRHPASIDGATDRPRRSDRNDHDHDRQAR